MRAEKDMIWILVENQTCIKIKKDLEDTIMQKEGRSNMLTSNLKGRNYKTPKGHIMCVMGVQMALFIFTHAEISLLCHLQLLR